MKKVLLFSMAAALTGLSLTAVAEIKPNDAIEYRQGIFKAFKWNLGPMAEMVRGKIEFDADEFSQRANTLKSLSVQPWEGFIPGSYGGDSSALPKIESNTKAYQEKIAAFEQAIDNLAAAAKTQDIKQIRAAFGPAGKSCKSCHDQFRQ